MSKFNYFSFLICNHSDHIDIYYNGIPLGVIKDDKFAPHHFKTPGGAANEVRVQDLPEPCPFNSFAELLAEITRIVNTCKEYHG